MDANERELETGKVEYTGHEINVWYMIAALKSSYAN